MKKIILLALLVTSCSTTKLVKQNRTRKYLDRKIESNRIQYTVVHNQIIIFENGTINDTLINL